MRRRTVLLGAATAAAAGALRAQTLQLDPSTLARPAPQPAGADPWPKAAFEATSLNEALARLGIANVQDGAQVLLEAPDIAGQPQPIEVLIETSLAKVEQMAVLADRLPYPLLALLRPPAVADLHLRLTVHLPRTCRLHAYLRSGGRWHGVSREVKLASARG
jgi:sulfur-oxidizing protein SoxY